MAYFEFPHTRNYDGDLGWVIKKIIELTDRYNDFFEYNQITFADPLQWDITKQYPPYQIVFDYDQGYSYISKRPVPAGVVITNGDYWCLVGPLIVDAQARTDIARILQFITNIYESGTVATAVRSAGEYLISDGQLYKTTATINIGEGYTEGINVTKTTIENMIDDITTPIANDVSTLQYDLGVAQGDITALQGDMTAAQGDITTLYGYRDFTTRKVVCISDSYGTVPDASTNWMARLKTYLNIPNGNFYSSAYSGAGFIGYAPTYTFKIQAQTIAAGMTSDERDAITDIVLGGGYNDAAVMKAGTSTYSDVITAINDTYDEFRLLFPNANIWTFMPAWNIDATTHSWLRIIMNLMQQNMFHVDRVAFIDNVYWLHRMALLDSTLFHPNSAGAYCIAKTVASVMLGGSPFCDLAVNATNGYIEPTITVSSAVTNVTLTNIHQLYDGAGSVFMSWQGIQFKLVNAQTTGSNVEIGEFTDGIMSGGNFLEGYSANVSTSDGKNGVLSIYQNKLRFMNSSGATIAAGTTVLINPGSISGPIML